VFSTVKRTTDIDESNPNRASRTTTDAFTSTQGSLRTPKGMGDLLPPEAERQRALTKTLINAFEQSGYDLVVTPLFEHAEVVERGTDALDPRELLRFVEPGSGEVAVLRPDITPQIARAIATRMAKQPPPFRLCYEGRVIRRRRGRARSHQQLTQAGIECVGMAGPEADVEVLELATAACQSAGLSAFRLELSHVSIAQSLLDTLPKALHVPVSEMLARKDSAALAQLAHTADLPQDVSRHLCALVEHYGDHDVLARAERELRWPEAQSAIASLRELVDRLDREDTRVRLGFDLSDARGSTYYTGMSFTVLAEGPGEPVASGGRYDQLLSRYGVSRPATGFAFDIENLQWALRASGHSGVLEQRPLRLALGPGDAKTLRELAPRLRAHGLIVATLPIYQTAAECLAFAKAWGYDVLLTVVGERGEVIRTSDDARRPFNLVLGQGQDGLVLGQGTDQDDAHAAADLAALQRWARGQQQEKD